MNYSGLLSFITSPIDRPLLIWGKPGTGKTESVERAGSELKVHVETLIASILEPQDIGGLPFRDDGKVSFSPPGFLKRLETGGILFLDELTTTHPQMQGPLLRLILQKTAGEFRLPESVRIIAASNPPIQSAGGWDLTPPLANRFIHASWEPDLDSWCPGRHPAVRGFLAKRPHLFAPDLPKEWKMEFYSYPSPRSWEGVGRIISCKGFDSELISGCVGQAATGEFLQYIKALDLLDPHEVLKNPSLLKTCKTEDSGFASLLSALDLSFTMGMDDPYKFSLSVGQFRKDWGRYILHVAYKRGFLCSGSLALLINDLYGEWMDEIKSEVGMKG